VARPVVLEWVGVCFNYYRTVNTSGSMTTLDDTVHRYADKLTRLNSKLDLGDKLNDTQVGNRILIPFLVHLD